MASVEAGAQDGGGQSRWLEVRVEEATGCNKESQPTWDKDFTEGFVKAEVRGPPGSKPTKKSTKTVNVVRTAREGSAPDVKLVWKEPLYLEISDTSSELRLLLCREKEQNGKKSTNVVTACGIFVKDIMDAVPIDKYFEMFKPGTGQEGGFVRLKMSLISEEDMHARKRDKSGGGGGGLIKALVVVAGLAAAGFAVKRKLDDK